MKGPATTLPYALSRSGDLRMVSKAQWDKEGLEGFEKRPAGTGSYQYVEPPTGPVHLVRAGGEPLERHTAGRSRNWRSASPRKNRPDWPCC